MSKTGETPTGGTPEVTTEISSTSVSGASLLQYIPVLLILFAVVGFYFNTMATLGYVAADIAELKIDVKELKKNPLSERVHEMELRIVKLEATGIFLP